MIKRFSGFILYILITILVVSLYLDRHDSLEKLELFLQDKMFLLRGKKEVAQDIVIVSIDDASLSEIGEWPWDRNKTARLIDAISAHDPRAVLFNLTFGSSEYQDALGYTDSLAASMKKAGNLTLGYYFSQTELPVDGSVLPDGLIKSAYHSIGNPMSFSRYPPTGASIVYPPPSKLADAPATLGFINIMPDVDHSVRWQPLIVGYRGEFYPSAQISVAAYFMGIKSHDIGVNVGKSILLGGREIPTDRMGRMNINFNGPENTFKYYSAADILNGRVSARELSGKLVIVGYTAFASTDVFSCPVSRNIPGVELTANVLENIIHGNLLKGITNLTRINLGVIIFIGLFSALVLPRMSLLNRLAVLLLFLVVLINMSYVMFSAFNTSAKVLYPGLEILVLMLSAPLMRTGSGSGASGEEEDDLDYEALLSSSQALPAAAWESQNQTPQYVETVVANGRTNRGQVTKTMPLSGSVMVTDQGTLPVDTSSGTIGAETLDHFGRYRLVQPLGKGAMGMVYKGLDPAIDRPVALKTIRLDQILDPAESSELRERLMREAKAAGKLSHPNIVTIYDVGEQGSVQYIAMEYLAGSTLELLIKNGLNWDYKTLSKVMIQICDAIDYAHENGIVHRDIKPANIMIMEGNKIKVMDFGIARLDKSASMTQTGTALGTPNYISPEQLKGQQVDRRSDIFSVGVVFYELLTGEKPFKGDTLSALIYSILHVNPPAPSELNLDIPRIFDKIIAKALVKDPDLRFQTAKDLAEILRKLI